MYVPGREDTTLSWEIVLVFSKYVSFIYHGLNILVNITIA